MQLKTAIFATQSLRMSRSCQRVSPLPIESQVDWHCCPVPVLQSMVSPEKMGPETVHPFSTIIIAEFQAINCSKVPSQSALQSAPVRGS